MTIAAILKQKPSNVVVVSSEDRIAAVVRGLARQKVGVALVMDGDNLVGIISERDVMRCLDAQGPAALQVAVEQEMVRNVRTCSSNTSVDEAIGLMNAGRFRHLPVLDESKLVGVLSIRDLLNAMVSKQMTDVTSLRGYVAGSYTRA